MKSAVMKMIMTMIVSMNSLIVLTTTFLQRMAYR